METAPSHREMNYLGFKSTSRRTMKKLTRTMPLRSYSAAPLPDLSWSVIGQRVSSAPVMSTVGVDGAKNNSVGSFGKCRCTAFNAAKTLGLDGT